jgi:hypothetical protein
MRATVASIAEPKSDGSCFLDPLLRREEEAVQPRLHSNPIEFDGIKTGIVQSFPDAEEFNDAPTSKPVADEHRDSQSFKES